ncbi:hypothetical protein BJ546DRAFT_598506 [Cryomyces antarcticus]|uniref:Pali-domain-containing protein n=1 Tax=Cryomyces antarcticus TaxID=329879 RepID=A0ABR0M049_9PEZI|nr:hypothetical protein LTR39_000133 [Cryomyces antarcticus]KAK5021307.1 hypothetical protein LTR60_000044 [Cryomyces antarcticus]KAK5147643.1 hypothetical protein LTR04_000796 [Oleoguttula sp. CCFEE 6159]KAK5257569.1 hypothetical protein LTR16_000254 [Cryomyces antarcticus]
MKTTSVTHWIGVVFILASAALLLVTTLSAPVNADIGILRVILTNKTDIRHSSVSFGTFGYCVLDVPPIETDHDWCGAKTIGYDPAQIMAEIDHQPTSSVAHATAAGLTRAMILHPIACGLAFLAFFLSLGAGVIGSLTGALVAFVAWVLTLAVMAIDFSLFGVIKNHINADGSGSVASYGIAMWTVLAATVLLFFGMLIVFFTCCSARRDKNTDTKERVYADGVADGGAERRRRFGNH